MRLLIRETMGEGEKDIGNSIYFLCNFSVNPKLLLKTEVY